MNLIDELESIAKLGYGAGKLSMGEYTVLREAARALRADVVTSIGIVNGSPMVRVNLAGGGVLNVATNHLSFAQLAARGVRVVNE